MRRAGVSRARMRATTPASASAWWVTSSGTRVTGTPQSSTIRAASGSTRMLNSADGVALPALRGAAHEHDLVAGAGDQVGRALQRGRDVGQRPDRDERQVAARGPAARSGGRRRGAGRAGRRGREARSVEPALAVDVLGQRSSRTSGRSQAAAIGTSRMPATVQRGARSARSSRGSGCRHDGDRGRARSPGSRRQQDRDGVVVTGIAVEDDPAGQPSIVTSVPIGV